jgi:hypothetical protein
MPSRIATAIDGDDQRQTDSEDDRTKWQKDPQRLEEQRKPQHEEYEFEEMPGLDLGVSDTPSVVNRMIDNGQVRREHAEGYRSSERITVRQQMHESFERQRRSFKKARALTAHGGASQPYPRRR